MMFVTRNVDFELNFILIYSFFKLFLTAKARCRVK